MRTFMLQIVKSWERVCKSNFRVFINKQNAAFVKYPLWYKKAIYNGSKQMNIQISCLPVLNLIFLLVFFLKSS